MFGEESKDFLYYLSQVFGWIYFSAWSVSFYGQVIENYRRGKINGLCFDYELYNLFGFTGYSIYTIWGYTDNDLGTGKVPIQDIIFAVHAVILTIVTLIQIVIYYHTKEPDQKFTNFCISLLIVLVWGACILIFVEQILKYYDPHVSSIKDRSYIFNSVIYLGWCKVFITLIKYIPQAYSNYKRQSTIGWNIHNILLDFTGGSLSFGQNIIDTIRSSMVITPDQQSPALNIAKYALSFISIIFDCVFMTQHYILYKDKNSDLNPVNPETLTPDENKSNQNLIQNDESN